MMTKEILLPFDLELPSALLLKAGELTCLYEEGNLRYIGAEDAELVRKIYPAVRKGDWATVPYKMENEIVRINQNDFFISYTATYYEQEPIYSAEYVIEGKADNTIIFSMKGVAIAGFKRNRIGLCLLHPLQECRGRKVKISGPGGSGYEASFPELISPALPFISMSQLEWATENGVSVKLDFEGDIFETEDQRNWSDASYKTYSTRSDLPRPVDVKPGDIIEQKITLKVSGLPNIMPAKVVYSMSELKVPFPQIGYCRPSLEWSRYPGISDWLTKIPFDHYRVTIKLFEPGWLAQLQQSLDEAKQVNTRLELVIFFSDDYIHEAEQLIELLEPKQLLVRSLLVLQKDHNVSPAQAMEVLYPILKKELPAVKIGYGTDLVFVDVNENRPGNIPFDFISFGIQPQGHAFDNRSILENLQSQADLINTAKSIAGYQLVCISPVTLKDRDSGSDDRQYSAFVASWTLMALQNLCEAYSITFYELFGPAGILSLPTGSEAQTGSIKPSAVYDALVKIFDFQPSWVVKRFNGNQLLTDGLLLENETGERLFFKVPEVYSSAVGIH